MTWSLPSNPFVGLRPFDPQESILFFGRHQQIKALLTQLHKTRFLAVVGSSGCGKSSLVRAGLIPSLQAGFLVEDRDEWLISSMKPGHSPFNNLAAALSTPAEEKVDISSLARTFVDDGAEGVLNHIHSVLDGREANILLLVDQFEEIFRFRQNSEGAFIEEASLFVSVVLRLAHQRSVPVYVCMTMRSDFLGDCDAFLGLPEALNESQYLVPRMNRQQRREAIEGPVHLYGKAISPRLSDLLLNKTGAKRDELPVLQHTLMRTWQAARANGHEVLDIGDYQAVGGLEKALSIHADDALSGLGETELSHTKKMFQALTEVDPENRAIRRPVKLSELVEISESSLPAMWSIIQKMREKGRSFIVLSSLDPGDNPMVDISHESLIRQWDQLKNWVLEEAQSARIYKRLAETAQLHSEGLVDYYRDPELQMAQEWKDKEKPNAAWAKKYHEGFDGTMEFLEESSRVALRKRRRRQITTWTISIIGVALTLGSLYLAYQAVMQSRKVDKQLALNYWKDSRFALDAKKELDALHFAAEALKYSNDKYRDLNIAYSVRGPLNDVHPLVQILEHDSGIRGAEFLGDENEILTWSENGSIHIWNLSAGTLVDSSMRHPAPVSDVSITPDKTRMLTWGQDCTVRLWDLKEKTMIGRPMQHDDVVEKARFNMDLDQIITISRDRSLRGWNLSTDLLYHTNLESARIIRDINFSRDGKFLVSWEDFGGLIQMWETESLVRQFLLNAFPDQANATALAEAELIWNNETVLTWTYFGGRILLIDAASNKVIGEPMDHPPFLRGIQLSEDEETLISMGDDNSIRIWDLVAGKQKGPAMHHDDLLGAIFDREAQRMVSWGEDENIRLWDVASCQQIGPNLKHASTILGAAFSPDQRHLLTWSEDGHVKVWKLGEDRQRKILALEGNDVFHGAILNTSENALLHWREDTLFLINIQSGPANGLPLAHSGRVKGAIFKYDDQELLSWSDDGTLRHWNTSTGKVIGSPMLHNDAVVGAVFSSDHLSILSWSLDSTARLWNSQNKLPKCISMRHGDRVYGALFSNDAVRIVTWSADKTARLWDAQTCQLLKVFNHTDGVLGARFTSDDKRLITWSEDGTAKIWDVKSGSPTKFDIGHRGRINGASFNRAENLVLTWGNDHTARIWNASNGEPTEFNIAHDDQINGAVFSEDEDVVLTWSKDGTARLWNSRTGIQRGPALDHEAMVLGAAFHDQDNQVITWSLDRTIRLWDIETSTQLESAFVHENFLSGVKVGNSSGRILSWSTEEVSLWDISMDRDLPADLFRLQIEALTGCRLNETTQTVEAIRDRKEWLKIRDRYIEIAASHSIKCAYPKKNVFALHFPEKAGDPRIENAEK